MLDILTLSVENNAPVQFDNVIPGPRLRAAVVVGHLNDETDYCGDYAFIHRKPALIVRDMGRRGVSTSMISLGPAPLPVCSGFLHPTHIPTDASP